MLKTIQFLNGNPEIVELLKENKVSLVGVDKNEAEAILETYSKEAIDPGVYWN